MEDKVIFQRKLSIRGDSVGVNLPIELLNYLEANAKDDIQMFAEKGKHGKFIALWKKKEE